MSILLFTEPLGTMEGTEAGFFAHLVVPAHVPRLSGAPDFVMDDVAAELEGVMTAARFLLSIREGALDFLEGALLCERWPEAPVLRRAYHVRRLGAAGNVVVETARRDLGGLRRRWSS